MAKIYGINGVITGKLGAAVYAVRGGEQLTRQYQPVVFNPNTQAQVAARAKLKLISQMSAIVAPVIAIPRAGAVSSRNMFTKVNYPITSYSNNKAEISLESIQLTKSSVGLPAIVVTRTNANTLGIALQNNAGTISRMVYCLFSVDGGNRIRYVKDVVVTEGGDGNLYSTNVEVYGDLDYLVLGYAVRDNTEAARVTFGNLEVVTASAIANIITSRTLIESDVTLSETRGSLSRHTMNKSKKTLQEGV